MTYNKNNNYDENFKKYARISLMGKGTLFLSFRDIDYLLNKYAPVLLDNKRTIKVLDYGCGAGRSSRFLKEILGFNHVTGVDVNPNMLQKAGTDDADGDYLQIESAKTGLLSESFDLVFSSFVLVEIASKEEIATIFKEITRLLKPQGLFIVVTPSL